MSVKKIKGALFASVLFAFAAIISLSATLAGCVIKTSHPHVKYTIEFQEQTYEVEYKLYRNMYPQTVQHFIELADSHFYDDTVIHDYTSSYLTGGGYAYDAASYDVNSFSAYLSESDKAEAYTKLCADGAITPTVYSKYTLQNDKRVLDEKDALTTLYGEFTSNNHTVKSGALQHGYGNLLMYYVMDGDNKDTCIVKTGKGEILDRNSKYNAATSLFKIDLTTSGTTTDYCIFATPKNDAATEKLQDLITAIDEYKKTLTSSSSFTRSTMLDNTTVYVPTVPIVIKSVKVTKY